MTSMSKYFFQADPWQVNLLMELIPLLIYIEGLYKLLLYILDVLFLCIGSPPATWGEQHWDYELAMAGQGA